MNQHQILENAICHRNKIEITNWQVITDQLGAFEQTINDLKKDLNEKNQTIEVLQSSPEIQSVMNEQKKRDQTKILELEERLKVSELLKEDLLKEKRELEKELIVQTSLANNFEQAKKYFLKTQLQSVTDAKDEDKIKYNDIITNLKNDHQKKVNELNQRIESLTNKVNDHSRVVNVKNTEIEDLEMVLRKKNECLDLFRKEINKYVSMTLANNQEVTYYNEFTNDKVKLPTTSIQESIPTPTNQQQIQLTFLNETIPFEQIKISTSELFNFIYLHDILITRGLLQFYFFNRNGERIDTILDSNWSTNLKFVCGCLSTDQTEYFFVWLNKLQYISVISI
ncbi:hypothetical protein QTN25_001156 [Entamoeba marina]